MFVYEENASLFQQMKRKCKLRPRRGLCSHLQTVPSVLDSWSSRQYCETPCPTHFSFFYEMKLRLFSVFKTSRVSCQCVQSTWQARKHWHITANTQRKTSCKPNMSCDVRNYDLRKLKIDLRFMSEHFTSSAAKNSIIISEGVIRALDEINPA